jgi:hypothetical protein
MVTMRDHAEHADATRATAAGDELDVPGKASANEPRHDGGTSHGRARGSVFAGLPWQMQHGHDEHSSDGEHEAERDSATETASTDDAHAHEPDPTNIDADAAALPPDMFGQHHQRVDAHDDADELEDDELPHRAHLEGVFGQDLGGIKSRRGADLSALGADASAEADHVAFESTRPSRGLVAHEVAHVLQQRRAGASATPARRKVAPEDSAAEREAETVQRQVDAGATRVAPIEAEPAGRIHLSRRKYAREDRHYNKHEVTSNRLRRGRRDKRRAGVRVGEHSDVWTLDGATAKRYRLANGTTAEQVDVITRGTTILCINPAHVRRLQLPGIGPRDCAFVWADGRGVAWIDIGDLAGNFDGRIKSAINRRARDWGPDVAPGRTVVKHFATGGTSRQANNEWVRQNAGGNDDRIQDYLEKSVSNGMGGTRTYFNVLMNLPQLDAAPVAIDFAQPNDLFFQVRGMEREVPIWRANERRRPTGGVQRWVYGYLAVNGRPDHSRRGWVPKRVLRNGRP